MAARLLLATCLVGCSTAARHDAVTPVAAEAEPQSVATPGVASPAPALAAELERALGRRGFVRPDEPALERLCAPLPPVGSRSP
jgi:hypothetical protein